ncbi:MAG: hypothetical protein PWQ20_1693 [Thermotogaceae bacterium]|jgi:glyoxylase-like metal-dependent hydrolase (beta-lactamase superfamily II)|nr:hypothetical protein [Thermotogaceae bacterium]MDN5338623.1 hypothetical protein [Thermotogaceae bacterium]
MLKNIEGNTSFVESYSNIGVFMDNKVVHLIDTGSNESLAAKLGNYLSENFPDHDFVVVHTHCHVDHLKGNSKLKNKLNAKFFAPKKELPLGMYPDFEGIYLFGAPVPKFLRVSFFSAKGVNMESLENLDSSISFHEMPGHSPGHTVFITPDGVVFTGDLVFQENVMQKYGYLYLMDVKEQLESLEKAKKLGGDFFLPSHGRLMNREEFLKTVDENMEFIEKQIVLFYDILKSPANIDEITGKFLNIVNFQGNEAMYFLARSYVSAMVKYFYDRNVLSTELTPKGLVFSVND